MNSQEKKFERVNQKRRTRAELLRAARGLVEGGNQNPSIGDVADHAAISRATAYRYFSSADELIREAVLDGVADRIMVPPANGGDGLDVVEARLDRLVSDVFNMVVENEGVFRALLGASASQSPHAHRGGRRLNWLREALSPLKAEIPAKEFEQLVNALALVTGIEALVVVRDVCELDNKQGERLLRWTAKSLLAQAVASHRV
jgi:AcrR family transcriptional regulator